jgi:anti-sigma-K factor RskA
LTQVASLLALGLEQPVVPARIRDRLLSSVADATVVLPPTVVAYQGASKAPWDWSRYLALAAAILLAVATGALYRRNQNLSSDVSRLNRELSLRDQQLTAERKRVDEIIANSTRMVSLSGDAGAPQATARLFWDVDQQEWVIFFYNLPPVPADKDYQLWYVTNDQRKLSARVFRYEAGEQLELRISVPKDIVSVLAATAVTLEPRGGSQQPTGQLVLKGTI